MCIRDRAKDAYEKILQAFSNHEADILIGTQMIVKGHDFSNVKLVGVLAADMSLHVNDFHAAERTFALLTQAAGRAGRGKLPGNVVIQTYDPDHYLSLIHIWKKRFAQRKQYKFFKCPMCKQEVRVPRGHGKICITCLLYTSRCV